MISTGLENALVLGGAVVGFPLMVFIAWRSLFGDRERRKRRCRKCLYNLSGTESLQCSECGHIERSEQRLFFRRRRPLVAVAAIASAVAIVLGASLHLGPRGVMGVMPTSLLITAMPLTFDSAGNPPDELNRRLRGGGLTRGQWTSLMQRCMAGDWMREPMDDQWLKTYGPILGRERSRLTDQDTEVAAQLAAMPCRVTTSTRRRWPIGVPPRVDLEMQDWWPAHYEVRIEARPQLEGAGTTRFYTDNAGGFRGMPLALTLPPLAEGENSVPITLGIARRLESNPDGAWERLDDQLIEARVRVEGDVSQICKPSESQDMSRIMRAVFRQGVVKWDGGGPSPLRFRFDMRRTFDEAFNDVAVGVRMELMYKNQLARRLDLWWRGGADMTIQDCAYGFDIVYEDIALLDTAVNDDDNWQMRIISDPQLALRAGEVPKYWAGDFTRSLLINSPDLPSPKPGEAAPDRGWSVERDDEALSVMGTEVDSAK